MLNKKEFNGIREEMHALDVKREEVIQLSRKIITLSKQVIYAAQRNGPEEAESAVKEIKADVAKLRKIRTPWGTSIDTNINSVAFQEYVEAMCFYEFVKNNRLPSKASLKVNAEDYLSGLCDLTGELGRKAIYDVIHKKFDEAEK